MGKGSNKTTTTTNQTYTPDPRISAAAGQALTGARSAAQLPFQMPVAPTAGFSPFQEQAFNQIQGAQGMALPYFDDARQFMYGSASPISEQNVAQYYNPMAQNVTNQLQNIFGQQNRMATSNAVRSAGGVGADRIGVAQANLANQQGLAAGQIYSGLYDKALAAAQQQKQMMAGAGFGMGQLGPAAQASYLQGTGALAQAGAQQQALQQQQQNAIYQQRLAEIAYPFQTPQYLAGITGGLAPALGGSTYGQSVTERPQPSPLNQILGIGGALLGGVMGGPAGASIGGSLGKGAGSLFGGGGYGAGSDMANYSPGGAFSGMTPVNQGFGYVPTYFKRGGKVIDLHPHEYAEGGSTYGDLASQRFANSPVGNPYASDSGSDEEPESYAEGGGLGGMGIKDLLNPFISGNWDSPVTTQGLMGMLSKSQPQGFAGMLGDPQGAISLFGGDKSEETAPKKEGPSADIGLRGILHSMGLAEGGPVKDEEAPPPLPGTKPMSMDTTTIVPKVPLRMGAGHTGAHLDLRHAPEEQKQGSGGSDLAATAAKLLPLLLAARGGPVNPFDAGQGFEEGGDVYPDETGFQPPVDVGESWEPEPLQGIDAPRGNTQPHWSLSDVTRRAREHYAPDFGKEFEPRLPQMAMTPYSRTGDKPVRETLFPQREQAPAIGPPAAAAAPAAPQNPMAPQAPATAPTPAAVMPAAKNPMPPTDELSMADPNIPLPRGNPRTTGGVRATMANIISREGGTPNTVGGFFMNAKDESGFNPRTRHPDQPRWGGEAHFAHGLFSEGGEEWNRYRAWLDKNHPDADWRDESLQTQFTVQNLKENYPKVWQAMQDAKTPGEAADAMLRGYLKPAAQHLADRSRRYLGGEQNPYDNKNIVGNRDMRLSDYLRSPDRPYPDATKRDWGQNLARSPWSALIVGGARMAQTTGPVGSALGAGIEAGMGHLEGQRKSLRTEEDMNMKADALFQHAKNHLDKYQRMTPYEEATKDWRMTKLETPTGAAGWKYRAWLNAHPGDEAGALEFAGGRRQVPEPQLLRWAQEQALREKKDDPNVNIDERAKQLFEMYKQATPSKQAKPMPLKKEELKAGERYVTAQGEATWDGEKFVN